MANTEALFGLHHHRVFRYLCRVVGQTDARDLTQDVFLRITRTAPPSGPLDDQRAWIFRIARNLAIDHLRHARRQPELVAETMAPARAASQDVSAAVNEALGNLPELDRDVFLLREVSGLSYDEIGKTCDLTPDAVRSRIHRARLQLRDMLVAPILARRSQPLNRKPTLE